MRLRHPEAKRKAAETVDFGLRPLEPGEKIDLFVVVSGDFSEAAGPFGFPEAVSVARHATLSDGGVYRVVHLQPAQNVQVVSVKPEAPVDDVRLGQYL